MVMPTPTIPSQAIAELHQGRKIEAIRLVREAQGLGLKEAKETVEAYVKSQPALQLAMENKNRETKGALVRWLVVFAAIIAAAYVLVGLK
jgi:hypothetical protein